MKHLNRPEMIEGQKMLEILRAQGTLTHSFNGNRVELSSRGRTETCSVVTLRDLERSGVIEKDPAKTNGTQAVYKLAALQA